MYNSLCDCSNSIKTLLLYVIKVYVDNICCECVPNTSKNFGFINLDCTIICII